MSEKVLAIDDEPLILDTIRQALEKSGYDVEAVSSPDDFLEAARKGDAALMIVDLHMGGADTRELIAEARKSLPNAKVLIVTGSVQEVNDFPFLDKPFRISELRVKVKELLHGP